MTNFGRMLPDDYAKIAAADLKREAEVIFTQPLGEARMPYIVQEARKKMKTSLHNLGLSIETPGELNYAITKLCKQYLHDRGTVTYTHLNTVIGVLECAKLEFYRVDIAPYEQGAMGRNGPVGA